MTKYYVAKDGSNSASGSEDSPWRTISYAMNVNLKAGDEVIVGPGTYSEGRIYFDEGGSAGNPVTLRSEVPGGAKIVANDKNPGILVATNHVRIEGFDVSSSGKSGITGTGVHHVEVIGNVVHDNAGNGIYFGKADFVTVEGNVVFDNAARGPSSGIHLKGAHEISSDDNGFRMIVRGNVAYDNITKFGATTDGNGISIDDFRNTQLDGRSGYTAKTLVEGNITYGNYGDGVQIAWSDYVTIRDNVSMWNNAHHDKSGAWSSEFVNMGSSNNRYDGNIAIGTDENPAIGNVSFSGEDSNTNVTWYDNVTWDGRPGKDSVYSNNGNSVPKASDGNLLGYNPGISLADLKALTQDLLNTGSFKLPTVDTDDAPPPTEPTEPTDPSDGGGDGGFDGITVTGDDEKNKIYGTSKDDYLSGGGGNDTLIGRAGADLLSGDSGSDWLLGNNGPDTLVGGKGKDYFVYKSVSHAQGDAIMDFSRSENDKIKLRSIDANTNVDGNQNFSYIGSKSFSDKAGELRYQYGTVSGDVDGDGSSDFQIAIATNPASLAADDFIL